MERVKNSFPHEQETCARTYSGWMLGLHRPARISEAIWALTLPPETTNHLPSPSTRPASTAASPAAAAGLAGELGARVEEPKRLADLVLGDEHDLDAERARRARRQLPGERRRQRVGDRPGVTGTGTPAASPSAQRRRALRLDGDDAHAGGDAGHGDPGDEPAAAAGDDDRVDAVEVLEDLEPDRPWPAIVAGASNGWTNTRPVSAISSSRRAKAAAGPSASRSTVAP